MQHYSNTSTIAKILETPGFARLVVRCRPDMKGVMCILHWEVALCAVSSHQRLEDGTLLLRSHPYGMTELSSAQDDTRTQNLGMRDRVKAGGVVQSGRRDILSVMVSPSEPCYSHSSP